MKPSEIEKRLNQKSLPSGIRSKGTNLTYQDKEKLKNGYAWYFTISRDRTFLS